MGQGQNKIALSLVDLQPTAIVELFELILDSVDKSSSPIRFHGGAIFQQDIKWKGNNYTPLPVESEGFEVTANGQMPRPKIRLSNKDYYVTDLLLNNNDLQFAKIIRRRTFVKYLDDINFDGGNPWGQADSSAELSVDTFVVSQKTAENKVFVELELSSPLDLENFEVNSRLLMSRYCSWYYRGNGCNYQGPPVETEYGLGLQLNTNSARELSTNGSAIFTTGAWNTGIAYKSGDASFIENTSIIINPHPDSEYQIFTFAKIWYVAQQDHTSTSSTHPDRNESFWLRDGCNKKLEGCKKRFQREEMQNIASSATSLTNNFIDFSHKHLYNSNNIASQATITGSSVINGSAFRNAVDGLTGTSRRNADFVYSWVSSGSADPYIEFTWPESKKINRIDLYDRNTSVNFETARIELFSGTNPIPVRSGDISVINNGSRTTTGFPITNANRLRISGVGSDTEAGLGEVCVFEPSGLGLYNDTFLSSGLCINPNLHIASWVQFESGVTSSNQLLNIFHNVANGNQYSGLNLYVSGGNNLVLDFATIELSGAPSASYRIRQKSISIPFSPRDLQPIHLETYGGNTSSSAPTSFPDGSIRISNLQNSVEYVLKPKNISTKFSGEFFLFKNPSYTGSTSNLFFGVNNWQYPTGDLNLSNSGIYSNTELTSSIKIGSTAIWSGQSGLDFRKNFFNRNDAFGDDAKYKNIVPRTYEELTGSRSILKTDLFAWWDMDLNPYPYQVVASNDSNQKIYLSGEYVSSMEELSSNSFNYGRTFSQETKTYLPFGGFPGTDKYGR